MSIATFFEALYGSDELPEGAYIELWSKDGGTLYVRDFAEAEACASTIRGNAYFGVCLAPKTDADHRADAQSVLYAPALWADIDVLSPHHSKHNLPATETEAYNTLMESLPLAPSCIVSTGGGIHAYWFLDELYALGDDADRVRFAGIIKGWQGMLRKAMRKRGWDLDATHDLARVMRIPGTFNANAGVQSAISFIDDSMRYTLDDFAQYTDIDISMTEAESLLQYSKEFRHVQIVPRQGYSNREPLCSRVHLLCDIVEQFRSSYSGSNPTLADDSRSTLDASLAYWMARYDSKGDIVFSDQDIADVIVDSRLRYARTRKELKKATRVDYLQRTIANARRSANEQPTTEKQEYTAQTSPFDDPNPAEIKQEIPVETAPKPREQQVHPQQAVSLEQEAHAPQVTPKEVSGQPPMPVVDDEAWNNIPAIPQAKAETWGTIGAQMGLWFFRAVIYDNTEPKELRFVVQPRVGGQLACVVMTTETLLNKNKVKAVFFDATGRVPSCLGGDAPLKAYQWELVAQDIVEACVRDRLPEEATEAGLLRIYLRQYILLHIDSSGRTTDNLEEAADSGRPFMSGGRILVNVTAFSQYLRTHGVSEWTSATKVAKGFLRLKMRKRITPYTTKQGKRRSITGYLIPDDLELDIMNELPSDTMEKPSAVAVIQ